MITAMTYMRMENPKIMTTGMRKLIEKERMRYKMEFSKETKELLNELNSWFIVIFVILNFKSEYPSFSWMYILAFMLVILPLEIMRIIRKKKRKRKV